MKRADCESVDYSTVSKMVPRANPDKLREIFDRFASVEQKGSRFMTPENFIRDYLGMYPEANYNRETVKILASAADTTKDGLISFEVKDNKLVEIVL